MNATSTNFDGTGMQVFAYAKHSITPSIYIDGFVDCLIYHKVTNTVLTQVGLMYVIDQVHLGYEIQIYDNKFNIKDNDEVAHQLKLKYVF